MSEATDNRTEDPKDCPKCDGTAVEAVASNGAYYWYCFNDGQGWEDCDFPDGPQRDTSEAALQAWNEHVAKY